MALPAMCSYTLGLGSRRKYEAVMNVELETEYSKKVIEILADFHRQGWTVSFPNYTKKHEVRGSVDMGDEIRHFAVTEEHVSVKVGRAQLTYYMLANLYYDITEYINLFNNQTEDKE